MDFFHQQIATECLLVLTLFEAQQMQQCTNQTKTSDSSLIILVTHLSPLCPVSPLTTEICLILFHWNHTFSPFNSPVTISEFNCFKKMVFIGAMSVFWWDQSCACQPGTKYKRRKFILDSMVDWIIALWRCPHPNSQKLWIFWNSSTGIPSLLLALFSDAWAISNPQRWCCESAALSMPAHLENSAVATELEKVSFHSNPKERQCQRMLKLPHNCTHLTR